MITEDYVSFEVAKLLKEKGFNEATYGTYSSEGDLSLTNPNINWNEKDLPFIAAPTLQMTMKWLREVHHIFISIDYARLAHNTFEYTYEVHNMDKGRSTIISKFRDDFETYEDAINEAIIKSLAYV